MNREELEAVIWQQSRNLGGAPVVARRAMAVILIAADDYAASTQGAVLAGRRQAAQVPQRSHRRAAVHYLPAAGALARAPCHPRGDVDSTASVADVTCQACRKTTAWLEAYAQKAMAS